jgi:SOS response regulatory protein OraA/RecX
MKQQIKNLIESKFTDAEGAVTVSQQKQIEFLLSEGFTKDEIELYYTS